MDSPEPGGEEEKESSIRPIMSLGGEIEAEEVYCCRAVRQGKHFM